MRSNLMCFSLFRQKRRKDSNCRNIMQEQHVAFVLSVFMPCYFFYVCEVVEVACEYEEIVA